MPIIMFTFLSIQYEFLANFVCFLYFQFSQVHNVNVKIKIKTNTIFAPTKTVTLIIDLYIEGL